MNKLHSRTHFTMRVLTDPIPIRLTELQRLALENKADATGLGIQDLFRRALWHMMLTVPTGELPPKVIDEDVPRRGVPGDLYVFEDGRWKQS